MIGITDQNIEKFTYISIKAALNFEQDFDEINIISSIPLI